MPRKRATSGMPAHHSRRRDRKRLQPGLNHYGPKPVEGAGTGSRLRTPAATRHQPRGTALARRHFTSGHGAEPGRARGPGRSGTRRRWRHPPPPWKRAAPAGSWPPGSWGWLRGCRALGPQARWPRGAQPQRGVGAGLRPHSCPPPPTRRRASARAASANAVAPGHLARWRRGAFFCVCPTQPCPGPGQGGDTHHPAGGLLPAAAVIARPLIRVRFEPAVQSRQRSGVLKLTSESGFALPWAPGCRQPAPSAPSAPGWNAPHQRAAVLPGALRRL